MTHILELIERHRSKAEKRWKKGSQLRDAGATNYDTFMHGEAVGLTKAYNNCAQWIKESLHKEDETVINCNQLEDEIDSEWAKCKLIDECMGLESATLVNEQFYDIARHFARWGADNIADNSKKVELRNNSTATSQELEEAAEEYAYNNWQSDDYHIGASEGLPFDAIGHTETCFKAGAEWQKKQDHYACRQCEKDYDNVFFKGAKHGKYLLTIEDIERLHAFIYAIKNNKSGVFTFTRLTDEQYQEVLNRFAKYLKKQEYDKERNLGKN